MKADLYLLQKLVKEKLNYHESGTMKGYFKIYKEDVCGKYDGKQLEFIRNSEIKCIQKSSDLPACFTSKEIIKFFSKKYQSYILKNKFNYKEIQSIENCLGTVNSFSDFLKRNEDYFIKQRKSIDAHICDSFSIFLGFDGYFFFNKKFKEEINEIQEKWTLKFEENQNVQNKEDVQIQSKNTTIKTSEKEITINIKAIKEEGKTENHKQDPLPFIKAPNIFKAFFEKILINGFKQKRRLFNVDNEIVPIGFERNLLTSKTENYIDTNYQNGIIYNPQNEALNQKEIFKTIFKKIFKKDKTVIRDTKWIFVLAGSGIGKTSLLIRLYLEANKFGKFENRVYFLPFSQRERIQFLNREDKLGSVLFLDAFDEDFSITKISKLTIDDITHLRNLTQSFEKIILTSRSQFFQDKFKIEDYVRNLGTETEFKYETFVLCPFTQKQIDKYIKRKFKGNKVKIEKAKRVIEYIGEDTNRQLLISQIDMVIDLLDEKDIPSEIKEYHIFDTMLTNWLESVEKTKIKNSNLKNKGSRIKAFDKENTYAFCRILAKYFYVEERDFYIGFSLKELQKELNENKVEHSSLKINRTFLVLTKDGNYRFAHKSIYEFFLAQVAVEDEAFDKKYFQPYKNNSQDDFVSKMYEQYILVKILKTSNDLSEKGLGTDVQYTKKIEYINQYANDIRFEPYFYLEEKNGKEIYVPYDKDSREWNHFYSIEKDISSIDKILGMKFNCSEGNENWTNENERTKQIRLQKRNECFKTIKPILRFFKRLRCLDLSELEVLIDKSYTVSNFRGGNMNYNLGLYVNNTVFNLRGVKQISNTVNFTGGFNVSLGIEKLYLVVDYNIEKFKLLQKNYPKVIYIFLSQEDLEKGKKHLLDVDRIRVLSKVRGFECVFFTEDKVLSEEEIIKCFPDVHKTKLTTKNIEYFKKAGSYVDYLDDNGVSLKQGVCEAFADTVFSQYPNTFPKLKSDEFEFKALRDPSNNTSLKKTLENVKTLKIKSNINYGEFNGKIDNRLDVDINVINSFFNQNFIEGTKRIPYNELIHKHLKERDDNFKNTRHLIIKRFQNFYYFQNLKDESLISLYIENIKNCDIRINKLMCLYIKRLGLEFGNDIYSLNIKNEMTLNLADFKRFEKLEELTLFNKRRDIIRDSDKSTINLKNTVKILAIKSLRNLNIDFYERDKLKFIDDKVSENTVIKSSIVKLSVNELFFNFFRNRNVKLKKLEYLKITNVFALSSSSSFIDDIIEVGKDFNLKNLVLYVNYPKDEKALSLIKEMISTIKNLNISNIELVFVNYEKEEIRGHYFKYIENILNYAKELTINSEILIGFSLYSNGFDSPYTKDLLYFSFNHLIVNKELSINFKRFFKNRIGLTFIKLHPAVFDNVFKVLSREYRINKIKLNNLEFNTKFFDKKVLTICSIFKLKETNKVKYIELTKNNINYLNFLNSNFETFTNNEFFIDYLSYNHVRFINVGISKWFFNHFYNIFTCTKKISFSSLKNVDLNHLSPLQEIELLTFYTPEEEKKDILEYKKQIEEKGIKVTINPHELKVINAGKGVFETEIIEE